VSDQSGNSISKQFILNVVDTTSASNNVWASNQTTNYYNRNVSNPLRVTPSNADSTIVNQGAAFSYTFGTQNALGSPVFAFLNLPAGLNGDAKSGTISGAFAVPGIYTLGVESADQAGNTAEGFVTVTVGGNSSSASSATSLSGSTAQVSTLNKVTVNNNVPFVYNISAVQAQQTEADTQLFTALAAVNDAKVELSNRQSIYDSINTKLTAGEADADKAAAAAAQANTDRQNAADRLTQTNKALNDA
jgi:hypothetical protein